MQFSELLICSADQNLAKSAHLCTASSASTLLGGNIQGAVSMKQS